MDQLLQQIGVYGLPFVLLGLLNNFLTTLIKIPIKRILKKKNNSHTYTRYITFLPIIIGALVTIGYLYLRTKTIEFNIVFVNTWVKNTTISLSLYAFEEKFLSSNAVFTEKEIKENQETLKSVEQKSEELLVSKENQNDNLVVLKGKRK